MVVCIWGYGTHSALSTQSQAQNRWHLQGGTSIISCNIRGVSSKDEKGVSPQKLDGKIIINKKKNITKCDITKCKSGWLTILKDSPPLVTITPHTMFSHSDKYIAKQRGHWQCADRQDRAGYFYMIQSLNFQIWYFFKGM